MRTLLKNHRIWLAPRAQSWSKMARRARSCHASHNCHVLTRSTEERAFTQTVTLFGSREFAYQCGWRHSRFHFIKMIVVEFQMILNCGINTTRLLGVASHIPISKQGGDLSSPATALPETHPKNRNANIATCFNSQSCNARHH